MSSVDDSLALLPDAERRSLQRIVAIARTEVPEAVDGLSYDLRALEFAGKPLLAVTASAHHLSLFPFSPAVIDSVRDRLDGFSLAKGTIRFTAENPVPDDVVRDIVRARLAEIAG